MSVHLRTKVAHLGGAYEQVQPHGAKALGSVGGAAWSRAKRRRKRTVAEAGRMLRCVWVRLYPHPHAGAARRDSEAWCREDGGRGRSDALLCVDEAIHDARAAARRDRRGAGNAVQAAWCRSVAAGRGSQARARCSTCVFSSGVRGSCHEGPGNLALGHLALGHGCTPHVAGFWPATDFHHGA